MAGVVKKDYCIREGYIHRDSYTHYSDIGYEDQYQDEVYQTAFRIMKENNLSSVYDVGCGAAFKLRKYFKDYNFTGAEIEPTLSWLKKTFPQDQWEASDFTKYVETDLFICSDVIEHLVDPDHLQDLKAGKVDGNWLDNKDLRREKEEWANEDNKMKKIDIVGEKYEV